MTWTFLHVIFVLSCFVIRAPVGPPVIIRHPKSISVNVSQNALLRCQAVADPPNMTYIWQKDGENVYHVEWVDPPPFAPKSFSLLPSTWRSRSTLVFMISAVICWCMRVLYFTGRLNASLLATQYPGVGIGGVRSPNDFRDDGHPLGFDSHWDS